MSGSEFDANVDRAHDLIVVDIVKSGRCGDRIAPRAIGGKAAPVVGIHRRIVGIGSLNIVVVGFSRAAAVPPASYMLMFSLTRLWYG